MKLRKTLKTFFIYLLQATFLMMLMGCSSGSTVNTVLTINQDYSGNRVIRVDIDQSVFEEYFEGTLEDLKATIGNRCPEQMTWEVVENSGSNSLIFQIDFQNLEEYKAKIGQLLGEESEVTIQISDNVWVDGIYIDENFTSENLLEWLKTGLVEDGLVSSSNTKMILAMGDTQVVYAEQKMNTGSEIYVDEVDYIGIDSIYILTDVISLDNYTRTTIFNIPQESYDKKGEEIDQYFNTVLPEKAVLEKSVLDGSIEYQIMQANLNLDNLRTYDETLFGASNVLIELIPNQEAEQQVFSFGTNVLEHIQLSNFIVDNGYGTRCAYLVRTEDILEYNQNDASAYGIYSMNQSEDYRDYYAVRDFYSYGEEQLYPLFIEKVYPVQQIEVNTNRTLFGDKWNKQTVFYFEVNPTEEEQNEIINRIEIMAEVTNSENESVNEEDGTAVENETSTTEADEAAVDTQNESAENIEVSVEGELNKDDVFQIRLIQKGKAVDILANNEKIFNNQGNISYASDHLFYVIRKQEAFEEKLDYSDFLDRVSENFQINYHADFGMLQTMDYTNLEDNATIEKGMLNATFYDDTMEIIYIGKRIDFLAVFFWIAFITSIASLLFLLYKNGLFTKIWNLKNKTMQTNKVNSNKEVSGVEEKVKPKQVASFCENCGASIGEDDLFCQQCGSKLR